MKRNVLIIIFIIISKLIFAQDYMDKIALRACDCINSISDTINSDKYVLRFGACLMTAASPYKKQLRKDHKIKDFVKQAKELGTLIGLHVWSVCPESMEKLYGTDTEEEKLLNDAEFEGRVINIEDDIFVMLSIKNESGMISKFYWLSQIESDIDLQNQYKTLLDKSVRITFGTKEIFDARIGEYRTFKIILKLQQLE